MKHAIFKSLIAGLVILFSMQANAQNITMTNGGNSTTCGGTFQEVQVIIPIIVRHSFTLFAVQSQENFQRSNLHRLTCGQTAVS